MFMDPLLSQKCNRATDIHFNSCSTPVLKEIMVVFDALTSVQIPIGFQGRAPQDAISS